MHQPPAMDFRRRARSSARFFDTGRSILTTSGTVFRTTEEELRRYAPQVLDRVPTSRLVDDADAWVRLPLIVALWALPVALMSLGWHLGALSTVGLYLVLSLVSPAIVVVAALPVVRLADKVLLQGLYYIVMMSLLAQQGRFAELWTGLAGFVLMRWTIFGRALQPVVGLVARRLYRLPVPDQVLRGLIIRHALRYGVPLPEVAEIEKSVRSRL